MSFNLDLSWSDSIFWYKSCLFNKRINSDVLKKSIFCLCFGMVFQFAFSQIQLDDLPNIKSVILKPVGANRYAPIIRLGETLTLSFDDLIADEHDYTFKIEHCDYDWEPSKLISSEFIDGYSEDRIKDYENSFNTLQPYTHYQLRIPNASTRIKISGNYKLHVLDEEGTTVFTRRFVVYEQKVTVGVAIFKSRDISKIEKKQSVEFTINYPNFRINNPGTEIIPVILQNNNWQTANVGLKPQYYRGTQLLYKYNKETSFWGGNEFLYFDSKSI